MLNPFNGISRTTWNISRAVSFHPSQKRKTAVGVVEKCPDNLNVKVANKEPVVATPSRLIISSIFNAKFNLEITMLIIDSHEQDPNRCPHAAQKNFKGKARKRKKTIGARERRRNYVKRHNKQKIVSVVMSTKTVSTTIRRPSSRVKISFLEKPSTQLLLACYMENLLLIMFLFFFRNNKESHAGWRRNAKASWDEFVLQFAIPASMDRDGVECSNIEIALIKRQSSSHYSKPATLKRSNCRSPLLQLA